MLIRMQRPISSPNGRLKQGKNMETDTDKSPDWQHTAYYLVEVSYQIFLLPVHRQYWEIAYSLVASSLSEFQELGTAKWCCFHFPLFTMIRTQCFSWSQRESETKE
jgi:hypothetical protein